MDGCPGLNWETLLNRCSGVERIRVTGIDREDDGTWLNRFMKMGGVDAEGQRHGHVRAGGYGAPYQLCRG